MSGEKINSDLLYTQGGRLKASLKFPQSESKHISSSNETQWETRCFGAIIVHGGATGPGFQIGETIRGTTTNKKGIITAIDGNSLTYYNYQTNNLFQVGETITNDELTPTTAVITTFNTGSSHYYDYYTSSVRLRVGLKAGERVSRRMVLYPPYFSGFEPTIEQTFEADLKEGVKQRVYVGDDLNGSGLLIDGRDIYHFNRSNVSGSPVETDPVHISDWANGRGIDFERAQIQKIVYKWLGYGAESLIYVQVDREIEVHKFLHAGKQDDVYMRTPSLPASFEIENTTDQSDYTELRVVCVNYSSEGGLLFPGFEFSAPKITDVQARSIADTDGVCLIGLISLKDEWPTGQPNRKSWRYLKHKTTVLSKNTFVQLVHLHNLRSVTPKGGALTLYENIPWVSFDDSSAVQYYQQIMTAWDAAHTHYIGEPTLLIPGVGGSGQGQVDTSEFINAHSTISQNYESNNSQCFGLVAKVIEVGTANIAWGMTGVEVE